jgi:DnaJ-class molecular chaperone
MTDQQWTMAAGITAAVLGVYWLSLKLYPYNTCGWCKGKGKKRPWWWPFFGPFRPCHHCSGKGRKQRWGAKRLGYGERRQKQSRWARKNRR